MMKGMVYENGRLWGLREKERKRCRDKRNRSKERKKERKNRKIN